MPTPPLLLLILDGWGYAPEGPGNAVSQAETPHLDSILSSYPSTLLACAGRAVGLPDGFMGNSEVGHMNIGAGRVVYQDMTRIDLAIEQDEFTSNPAFVQAVEAVKASGGKLHLMGLVSDGGVHSHQNHINALLDMAKANGLDQVYVHAFLDGRDTPPTSGKGYVSTLLDTMSQKGIGKVASVTGRFYAMDRDKRWDRNALAYAALVQGEAETATNPLDAIQRSYDRNEGDEFVKPCVMTDNGEPMAPVQDGDAIIFFNFRADRARQICRAFFDPDFDGFERKSLPKLAFFVTMTRYEGDFPMAVAFPPVSIENTLGQTVSEAGLAQLRIAETEKYAHVTYFLNCGREEPFPNENRVLVPSPREVATYDQKPVMSAREVTDKLLERLDDNRLCVCNLANLDMVGHTGIIKAAVEAVECVDECVGRIVDAVLERGGTILMTADHGNAEEMIDPKGNPQTAHSTNPVRLVYIASDVDGLCLRDGGKLGDIAPTALAIMGLQQPEAMTGVNLVENGSR
ncbi:MAG: 2,3-bisphosphoglycerate-independent phosphoglycerate mutase [Desulfovibrio sp.]|uniref:2,3-bisphosphoglycerate-independent phosphoglycerate mutase n=1 Tax=Desulfovibrio sp. 7SRBS1 TaxID=3378064 RepID=UPI003B3C3199